MTAWRRWQDYVTMLAGIVLFISPFVFGETSQGVAAVSAYILGALLFLGGLLGEAVRRSRGVEIVPAVIAVITFFSPWILGFTGVTGVAWTAWVTGVVALIAAAVRLFGVGQKTALA